VINANVLTGDGTASFANATRGTTAAASGQCLVTENVRDYRPLETALLAEGRHHHGIIYTTVRQFPRGDPRTVGLLVRALDAALKDPPPMFDRSIFLR
jgi:hypothetical protein